MANRCDLCLTALALFSSADRVSSVRYSKIGFIHVSPSSSTTASISASLIDFSLSSSTNTCLLKCAKLIDTILLNASAFLFSLLGTYLIENALKLLEDLSVNKIHGSGSSSFISTEYPESPPLVVRL
ncbi:hypothetical protein Tco_0462027 [Tanacetum coccineum]